MAFGLPRSPDSGQSASAVSYPIARSFAFVVLLAVLVLFALHHIFGSIHVEAGVR